MKKATYILTALLCILVASKAVRAQTTVGARGGFLLSTIEGTHLTNKRTQPGFHLSGFVTQPVSPKLAIESGIGISRSGMQGNSANSVFYSLQLISADIPLFLVANLKPGFPTIRFGLVNSRIFSATQTTPENTINVDSYIANWNHSVALMLSQQVFKNFSAGIGVSGGINNVVNIARVNENANNPELLLNFRSANPANAPGPPYAEGMRTYTFNFWLSVHYALPFKSFINKI